jgi:hypothetical protein
MFSFPALRTALVKTGLVNRRAIARILSTLLCSLVVTIRPFSSFGGPYPFLVLTVKELIFAIQENLAQQLEGTVLNVTGALFAIGISTVAKYLADLPNANPVMARTVPAIFLVFTMFIGESTASFDTHRVLTVGQLVGSRAVYPGCSSPCEFAVLYLFGC